MAEQLERLKEQVNTARNLSYASKYTEAVIAFDQAIDYVSAYVTSTKDPNLLTEAKKCLVELQLERSIVEGFKDMVHGDLEAFQKIQKQANFVEKSDPFRSRDLRAATQNEIIRKSPRKHVPAHEDDELYNRKEQEERSKIEEERKKLEEERRKFEEEKAFEERNAEIWPKNKPVLPSKHHAKPKATVQQNQSNIIDRKRDYEKPWTKNTKKKQGKEDEKKSYMKSVYPDGPGPDAGLIEMLEKEVICLSPNVLLEDIADLDKAKQALIEAVIWPLEFPELFTGIRQPCKGVLLYGPPGTGKTMLAKAIASTGRTTFFSVTASTLASKWKGESQKLVRILFDMARFYSPATIFIDEIDALASKRGQREDESSRKVKTELMARIDGAGTNSNDARLMIIGATNRPWDLDEAIRRRLQRRIYIPLPNEVGREAMLKIILKGQNIDELNFSELVKLTDGFSGADIKILGTEASMIIVRKVLRNRAGLKMGEGQSKEDILREASESLKMEHFAEALKQIKPSVCKQDLNNFDQWTQQFGQVGRNQ